MKKKKTKVLDISTAILNHLAWKIRLHDIINDKEIVDSSEKISHEDCELGRWLYSELLPAFGSLKEVRRLEKTHKDIHDICKKVLQLKYGADTRSAESELVRLEHLSQEMFSLLLAIRSKIE